VNRTAILVTGGTGQVGIGIKQANRGRFDIVAPGRHTLDLANPATIKEQIASRDWAAIVNCAAYTAVDKAESDEAAAFAINADAPGIIARAAAARSIPLLHVSTDYVFDGSKTGPYVEEDPVAPLGVYGASKEAGERAVRAAGGRHIILRTAWVVSPWGNNFIKTMLRLGAERERLGVVDDQIGCPTSAKDIAEKLLTLAEKLSQDPTHPGGTYHFVNDGETSWYALAAHIFDRKSQIGAKVPVVDAIASVDYPTPAKRPANSRLSTAKIQNDFCVFPRAWEIAVDEIIDELG
jgi:dTDP-4-dehydrorhamnose reductase